MKPSAWTPELERALTALRRAGRDRRIAGLALAGLGLTLFLVWEALSGARPAAGTFPLAVGSAAPEPAVGGMLADLVLKLGLVIALIYGSLFALRRWPGGALGARPARRLAVLETSRLSPRQAVHVLRVGERTLLIGATDQTVTLLAELAPAAEPAAEIAAAAPAETPAQPFADLLAAAARSAGPARP